VSFFDLAAGLTLIVSGLVGFIRGGIREAAGIAAWVLAAIAAFLALRFTGPIARQAIHTVWLANVAAVLVTFVAVFALMRALAAAISRGLHRTAALGALDRLAGAGLGLARACVALGLAVLLLDAIFPPQRMPTWISDAKLYPLGEASAGALKAFAPKGQALAARIAPEMGRAMGEDRKGRTSDPLGSLRVDVERAK
jgi:membrane protein required for colicin V production